MPAYGNEPAPIRCRIYGGCAVVYTLGPDDDYRGEQPVANATNSPCFPPLLPQSGSDKLVLNNTVSCPQTANRFHVFGRHRDSSAILHVAN